MSEEAARLVVWSILVAALAVWMGAVRFVARVRNVERARDDGERVVFESPAGQNELVGQVNVNVGMIPSPDPQLRWQSLQALQVVHVLWPPFQLAAVHRASRAAAIARIEALLANLPHLP